MNRINLLYRLDDLLVICNSCEKRKGLNYQKHPDLTCKGCATYAEIRNIGDSLERRNEMGKLEMTPEEFVDLRYVQNLSMVKIAESKGVKDPTVHHWKNKHAADIEKALEVLNSPTVEEKKAPKTKTTPKEKNVLETVKKEPDIEPMEVLEPIPFEPVVQEVQTEDVINKPSHYHQNGIDVIGFSELQFPKAELKGFYRINCLKYITRYDRKNNLEDLKKANFYLTKLIDLESNA